MAGPLRGYSAIARAFARAGGHPSALAGVQILERFSCALCASALVSAMPKSCPNSQDIRPAPVRAVRKPYAKSGISTFSASARAKLFSKVP